MRETGSAALLPVAHCNSAAVCRRLASPGARKQSFDDAFGSLRIELVGARELGERVSAPRWADCQGTAARIETGREEVHVWRFDGDRPVAGYDRHAFRFGSAEHTVLMMRRELDALPRARFR